MSKAVMRTAVLSSLIALVSCGGGGGGGSSNSLVPGEDAAPSITAFGAAEFNTATFTETGGNAVPGASFDELKFGQSFPD